MTSAISDTQTRAPEYTFAGAALLTSAPQTLLAQLREVRSGSSFAAADPLSLELERILAAETSPFALEREYVRLFLDPLGAPFPLWQSVHEPDPRMMSEAHHSALAWYRRLGLEPHAENEPADHAGLLLLFFARMLAGNAASEECSEFRRRHLDWLPPLLEGVRREAHHPFYLTLAAWLTGLLANRSASPR
jgi:TorA maturation chaperone TorD